MKTAASIRQRIAVLQAQHDAILSKERQGVIARIQEAISTYSITVHELTSQKPPKAVARKAEGVIARGIPKGSHRPVKYRHGQDAWAGGGGVPRWLKALEAEGHDREEFRVG